MRLVNHSNTRNEVEISEGLGGGSRYVVLEPRRGFVTFDEDGRRGIQGSWATGDTSKEIEEA